MRLGFSIATDMILDEMKTLDPYTDYFETYTQSDSDIETIKEYIDKITVVHLPDLNNRCIQALKQTTKLNIEKAVVHYYTINPWSHEKKRDTLEKLVGVAEENEVKLCLENTEESPKEIKHLIDKIPNLRFCLDMGHGNIFSNTPSGFITHLGEHIGHIHIHDNHGGNSEAADTHLLPGEGNIDFNKTLQGLKNINYMGDFTLELPPMDSDERKIWGLKDTRVLLNKFFGGVDDGLG